MIKRFIHRKDEAMMNAIDDYFDVLKESVKGMLSQGRVVCISDFTKLQACDHMDAKYGDAPMDHICRASMRIISVYDDPQEHEIDLNAVAKVVEG